MNNNLLNIVRQIIAEKGEGVLADPQQLKPLFSNYAKNEPKEERAAFGRCMEIGSYQELKSAPSVNERRRRMKNLADQMSTKYGITRALCADALDLLEEAMFNKNVTPKPVNAPAPAPAPVPVPPVVPSPVQNNPPPFTGYMINNGSNVSGPYSLGQMEAMIKSGQITLNYMVCTSSGNWVKIDEIPELEKIFNGTGNPSITVNTIIQNPNDQNNNVPNKRFRHGFTSFWLWISFIGSILGLPVILFLWYIYDDYLAEIVEYFYPSFKTWLYWCIAILAAIILGLWKIIKSWKRSGFYWLVLADIASIILVFIYFPSGVISAIFSCSVFPVLTYFILKIRNGYTAKSTWEQMD